MTGGEDSEGRVRTEADGDTIEQRRAARQDRKHMRAWRRRDMSMNPVRLAQKGKTMILYSTVKRCLMGTRKRVRYFGGACAGRAKQHLPSVGERGRAAATARGAHVR